MTTAEEVLAGIDTARNVNDTNASEVVSAGGGVDDTMARADAAKARAEELADQLAGMGINDRAGVAGQVSVKLAEAKQAAAGAKSQLDTARAGLGRVKSLFDEAYVLAQSLGGLRAQAAPARLRPLAPPGSSSPGAVATPLDVPGRNGPRVQYQTGDQVSAPDGGPDAYHAELKGESSDTVKSKMRRFGRSMVRQGDDLSTGFDQVITSTAREAGHKFDPYDNGQQYSTTSTASDPPPVNISAPDRVTTVDQLGSVLIFTAVALEGLSRLRRRKADD